MVKEKTDDDKKNSIKKSAIIAIVAIAFIFLISSIVSAYWFRKSTKVDFSVEHPEISAESLESMKEDYTRAEEILAKDAYNFDANMTKAEILFQTGDYEKALIVYEKLAKLNSSDSRPFKAMGDVYFNQGKYDEAESMYLTAIEKDAHNLKAYKQLSEIYRYYKKDDKAKIEKFYQDGINNLGDDKFAIVQSYAYYLEDIGEYERAIEQLKHILIVFPDEEETKNKIAELQVKLSK